ncbi:MAG: phosphatase PAP2 family protein [Deltaproteobacteria bacterium]|nr:phosphatase PAP2 family protein [Deltaproteobacteria bacterium]MBW2361513.1 phosphatase PAP2 family protein [Deltaproteobacteria bacterium]
MRTADGSARCRRTAALALVSLAVVLATNEAHARSPWCNDLPASLELWLEDVGCDTSSGRALLDTLHPLHDAGDPLAPLHRLPARAEASGALRLPHVSLHRREGPARAYRSDRELLLRMGVIAGISTALLLAVEPPHTARWRSTPSFDDDTRNALRAGSRGGRQTADIVSDLLLAGLGAQLLADWYLQRDVYPGLRSVYIDGSWLLLNEAATRAAKAGAGRQRPSVTACDLDSKHIEGCNDGRNDNASFYSGHASWSASLAGLVCARRQAFERPDEAGIRWGDVTWCGLAITASLATGVLRIVADRHHMSDVGAGWTAGFLTGFVLPRMFDYRAADGGPFSRFRLSPMQRQESWGLQYSIRF